MSDNKLLAENTIRRFMKLANTETFSQNFIEGLEERADSPKPKKGKPRAPGVRMDEEEINEEEEVELEENFEDLQEEEEEMEMDAELGDEPDAEAEPMDAEPVDAEPEMGAADMSLTEEEAQLLISLGERLSAAMGEAEEEPADDAMPEPDMEMDMDMDMGDEEEAPAMKSDMMEEEIDQEDLVNEVLKRVTKRLVAEKLKNRK